MDPKHPGIHYRIARILEAQSQQSSSSDDLQAALKEFDEELQLDPQNANAAYESGVLYAKAGQLEKARGFFEEALNNHSDFEEAQLGLGGVLIDLDKPTLAIPHFKRAAELDPDDDVSYYRLARAYKAIGKTGEARDAFTMFQHLREQKQSKETRERGEEDVTRQTVELKSVE
jgi:tetratricopeptide (TPR) repeat protein